MISRWTAIALATAMIYLPLIALADGSGAAAKVQIFKCVSGSGAVLFQKSPCPNSDRTQIMQLTGDSPSNRDAANRLAARLALDDQDQQAQAFDAKLRADSLRMQAQANTAAKPQVKPPVVCPPTFGDVVTMQAPTVTFTDASGVRRTSQQNMALQYRLLPTKTYLKNAGRWPKECPQ